MYPILIHGDCLEWIPKLPKQSVDLIFCDPPFGSIKAGKLAHIDKIIPPDQMWDAFRHVLKPSATVVVFGTQPFISRMICASEDWFRYDLIWKKSPSGYLNCNTRPMRSHQTIAVFSQRAPAYNPQMLPGEPYTVTRNGTTKPSGVIYRKRSRETINITGDRYPTSVLEIIQSARLNEHPFEKPLLLVEWIIKTYSNEGMTVLDPTMGSGGTGVVCRNLGRRFIGIERDESWFYYARDRINQTSCVLRSRP